MIHESAQAHDVQDVHEERLWGGPYRRLTSGLLLTVAGAAFEALAVATILSSTVAELGGLALYGWAFSAFMLTNLIGIITAGAEADRQGPAGPFVAGVLLFVLGLIVAGLAPSMPVLIAARGVQGLGAGVISAVAYTAIGRGYPEHLKPRMLAMISSAWVIPGLIGPALAGLIADHIGWRWVFLGLAPLPLIAAGLAWRALRRLEPLATVPRDWHRTGAALRLALGSGLFVAGLDAFTWASIALLLLGGLLALPALRQLLPPGTLRAQRGLPAAIATNGLLSLAFFGVDAFIPLALTSVRGETATAAGIALTAATVCWTTGAWLQAHFAATQSRRRLVMIGLALSVVGIGGSAAVLLPSVPLVLAPISWGIAGLGVGLAFSTLALVVLETAPRGHEGTATSALQLVNVLGVALGAGIGGSLVAAFSDGGNTPGTGIGIQDLLMIGVVGLAVASATRMPRRTQGRSGAGVDQARADAGASV